MHHFSIDNTAPQMLLYKARGGRLEWLDILAPEIEAVNLEERLAAERRLGNKVFPSTMSDRIFRCFNNTPWDETLVVILGQDPYPRREFASGLAFGVPKSAKKLPGSLRNIARELKDDVGVELRDTTLESWADQGVLLMNTHFTVGEERNSHRDWGWDKVSGAALRYLDQMDWPIVFILWGRVAQKLGEMYVTSEHHLKIESPHPSPESAHTGFLGSKPFSKCNEFLSKQGLEIEW